MENALKIRDASIENPPKIGNPQNINKESMQHLARIRRKSLENLGKSDENGKS